MQVYKILKLLDLTGKTIPCDMQDQLSQTYFSESKQVPIAIGDMDIVLSLIHISEPTRPY